MLRSRPTRTVNVPPFPPSPLLSSLLCILDEVQFSSALCCIDFPQRKSTLFLYTFCVRAVQRAQNKCKPNHSQSTHTTKVLGLLKIVYAHSICIVYVLQHSTRYSSPC